MICPNCRSQYPDGSVFCQNCGAKLEDEGAAAPNTVYADPSAQNTPYAPYAQAQNERTRPLRTGEYFLTMFLLSLPVVGFILCLVWGFDSSTNENKRNFCRAQLIWIAIAFALSILTAVILVVVGGTLIGSGLLDQLF